MKPIATYACILLFALSVFMPVGIVEALDVDPGVTPIQNPLGDRNDLGEFLLYLVNEITKLGFYVVVFFIILTGFKYVTARGNETEIRKAHAMFLWTVIGAAVLLGAMVFARVIEGTVNQLKDDPAGRVQANERSIA
jgi:hypothetical protein